MQPDRKSEFWDFVAERQAIYNRRAAGHLEPWTEDKILREHHFTNMYRELDKGTFWFQERRSKVFGVAVWQAVVYRLLNRSATFEDWHAETGEWFPEPEEAMDFCDWCDARMARKQTTFTGRHQTIGMWRFRPALADFVSRWPELLGALRKSTTAHEAITALATVKGIGPRFFGNQIYMDLQESGYFPTHPDGVWVGPGAKVGFQVVYENITPTYNGHGGLTNKSEIFGVDGTYQAKLQELVDEAPDELERRGYVAPIWLRGVTRDHPMRPKDVEHALCEFSKYVCLSLGRASSHAGKRKSS